jgi:anaerobic magnesium-protoporphyrin IX monomethyl ester cyclase
MINPPAENLVVENPDEQGESFIEADDYGYFPPLGMLYVLSHLEAHTSGHDLHLKDCVAEHISHGELAAIVEDIQPDVVGITSFTISLVDVVMVARTVRAIRPDAHICLGGHHPIAFPVEAASLKEFDSVIVGEGEIAFTDLVNALEKDEDYTSILGVYTSDSIKPFASNTIKDKRFLAHVTVPPAYVEDVDTLPFPNRRFINHIDYHSIVGIDSKLATIITSRGCPYLCTFCDVPYKKYRQRSHASVLDEVEECMAMGYGEFHFYDDLFNINEKKVLEFCDEIERRGLEFTWDFRGRVNTITRPMLERAQKCGLRMISFGIETGTDAGLRELRKGSKTQQARDAFKWCRELGIDTIADFIIGLPFEKSENDINESVDFLLDINPDYLSLAILTLYPNTEIYDQALAKGLIEENRWRDFSLDPKPGFTVDHWEEHMSVHELVKLQRKVYHRFYFRPSYILKSFLKTRTLYEFKAKLLGMLTLLGASNFIKRKKPAPITNYRDRFIVQTFDTR